MTETFWPGQPKMVTSHEIFADPCHKNGGLFTDYLFWFPHFFFDHYADVSGFCFQLSESHIMLVIILTV